jgi:glycosyltransferase involved in cell wall biosynthesis
VVALLDARRAKAGRMKKIVVDARMVGPVGHGVARYVQLMAKGLAGLAPRDYDVVFLTQGRARIPGFECVPVRAPFLSPTEWIEIPAALKRLGADLYHSPSFASLPHCPCPWVITVHDLIHLHFGGRARRLYYRALLRPFIRRARAVMTVSEYSRGLIRGWAGVDSEVVYNPIEDDAAGAEGIADAAVLSEHSLRRGKFFLCLSNEKAHKNLARLLAAHARYRESRPEAWPLAVTAASDGLGIVALRSLPPAHALALLRNAGALVYPSLMEGFGRPPLEAAVQGVPVVVSRIPPHVEAMVDFAPDEVLWVEPWDEAGWAAALKRAEEGEVRGASPATRAAILARYSVERMGRDMDRIYRRVLG